MPLILATIVDDVTEVDAASVNQYKTAIQTLAGAGWNDSGGDLDVEELSDAVKTPGDGLDYSGGNLVVDVADLVGTGLENDGSNNLRIAAAAAGNGLTGGAGSALAVNVDNATLEINTDIVRIKDSGVSVAKMASAALSGRGNTAGRPANAKAGYLYDDTQTNQVLRDTGAAWEEVTGVISAVNVLDLTDGGATTLHNHGSRFCLWSQSAVQAAANTDAPASAVFSKTDANNTWVVIARIGFYKSPEIDSLMLRYDAVAATGGTGPQVRISDSKAVATPATVNLTANSTWTPKETQFDIAAIPDDTLMDILVEIHWTTADGGAHDLQVRNMALWAEPVSGPA